MTLGQLEIFWLLPYYIGWLLDSWLWYIGTCDAANLFKLVVLALGLSYATRKYLNIFIGILKTHTHSTTVTEPVKLLTLMFGHLLTHFGCFWMLHYTLRWGNIIMNQTHGCSIHTRIFLISSFDICFWKWKTLEIRIIMFLSEMKRVKKRVTRVSMGIFIQRFAREETDRSSSFHCRVIIEW